MNKHSRLAALLIIVIIAAAIRLPGVFWELPDALHSFSYHPDELPVLGAASTIDPGAGDWNPGFYNYGTLQIYLLTVPIAFSRMGSGLNMTALTLLARLLTVLFAVGTVMVCWRAGERVGGLAGAIAAASVVAIAPLHVQQSQFVTVDVAATFWVALTLLVSMSNRPWMGGIAAGLAAATKYTTGLIIIAPLVSVLTERDRKTKSQGAVLTLLLAGAGFVLGCPGIVLWPKDFWAGFGYELFHAKMGHGLVFLGTGPGWLYHILHSLLPGLGWPLLALTMAAIVKAVRAGKALRPTVVFAAVFFLAISTAQVRFARYTLPLVPAFAIMIAALAGTQHRVMRAACWALLSLTFIYSGILEAEFLRTDPRTAAAIWIKAHVPQKSVIAFPSIPWFYSPPLSADFGSYNPQERKRAAENAQTYKLLVPDKEWDKDLLDRHPGYVIVSNYEAQDRKRLNERNYQEFMRVVAGEYSVVKTIGGDPPAARLFSLTSSLPHDMQYVSPRIEIYARHH